MKKILWPLTLLGSLAVASNMAMAAPCDDVPSHAQLKVAIDAAVVFDNGGLNVPMWATIVGRDGTVCAVASSSAVGGQWPISRLISAQKANTANGLTITAVPGLWSTARLFTPTQPGQFLFGLQMSNPVNSSEAYQGDSANWGTEDDYLSDINEDVSDGKIGVRIGGINVFGGGVSLWSNTDGDDNDVVIGGVGVSGDTSCADHNIALRVRDLLGKFNNDTDDDNNPLRYADNIIYDIQNGFSASGLGHPACPGGNEEAINTEITEIEHPAHDTFASSSYPAPPGILRHKKK